MHITVQMLAQRRTCPSINAHRAVVKLRVFSLFKIYRER